MRGKDASVNCDSSAAASCVHTRFWQCKRITIHWIDRAVSRTYLRQSLNHNRQQSDPARLTCERSDSQLGNDAIEVTLVDVVG